MTELTSGEVNPGGKTEIDSTSNDSREKRRTENATRRLTEPAENH
jgi:hypothetical protein